MPLRSACAFSETGLCLSVLQTPFCRDKILATIEEDDERLAVDLMYRAITAPLMQARCLGF